jgi:hypothetical protein
MFLESANPTASAFGTQVTLSAISVAFIQWLKNSPLMPYMHAGTNWLNRVVSLVLAAAAAVGVHVSWAAAVATPGTYTLTFTGVTLASISLMAWGIVKSMAFNELIYRGTVKSITPPPSGPVTVSGGGQGKPMAQELKG